MPLDEQVTHNCVRCKHGANLLELFTAETFEIWLGKEMLKLTFLAQTVQGRWFRR